MKEGQASFIRLVVVGREIDEALPILHLQLQRSVMGIESGKCVVLNLLGREGGAERRDKNGPIDD